MTPLIHIIAPYAHKTEKAKFERVAAAVRSVPARGRCVVLAGYRCHDYAVDVLIVSSRRIVALTFVDGGGSVTARESGYWTAGKRSIGMGAMGEPTTAWARRMADVLTADAGRLAGMQPPPDTCVGMVFDDGAAITNLLHANTQEWLRPCAADGIGATVATFLGGDGGLTVDEADAIIRRLGIHGLERQAAHAEWMRAAGTRQSRDCAADIYPQLEHILCSSTDIRTRYDMLRDIFRRIVDQGVQDVSINFSGTFAKLDFIVKELSVASDVADMLNATRHSLNNIHAATPAALAESLPYDVKSTAMLASIVGGRHDIPPSFLKLLPDTHRKPTWGRFATNSLRCIVRSWDDDYIYATDEQASGAITICYGPANTYLSRNGNGDWAYLRRILRRGSQLNLVRLRYDGTTCLPELIIYEPDLLINVTTVASCFEVYAESPFVALINKLKPQPNSLAIHLGNLSGQYLDDTVHGRDRSFAEGFTDFFRHNAISLVACDETADNGKVARFYDDARTQKRNITQLISHDLPESINGYDPRDVVLEPTFFSEMLGLQGRMDFLYEHNGDAIIIEQKSGKAAFTPFGQQDADPAVPVPQEKHVVQLLLYRALFVYEFQKYAGQLNHVMLLYSKFARGLVAVSPRPELLLRAIRMRNLLAWSEMAYADGGMRLLERVTPSSLNKKGISGRLWDGFIHKQLSDVLAPVHDASPLERAYYFRFMQFIAREQMLSKIGNKSKDDSGFAAKWLDTLQDKKAAGNIYDNMTIESFGLCGDSVESVVMRFGSSQPTDTSNFRKGDIVIFYPYADGSEPNACAQMVTRASIKDITTTGVELTLRNNQTDRHVFNCHEGTLWAIEHDMFDSSTNALYCGMHSLLSANKERRDLLLHQRQPLTSGTADVKGAYGPFDELVRRAKQALDMFLIIGPPGTGKTSFGLLNLLQEELLGPGTSVLLLSYTNRAVDEICGKLKEPGVGIDFIRIGSELSCDDAYHDNLLSARAKACATARDVKALIANTRVFCATTSAMNANISLLKIKHFSLAIIDEASQILEPHLTGLLAAHTGNDNAIGRFVLIGDHKQLPAVVQQTEAESRIDDAELLAIGLTDCRKSLFERMLSYFRTDNGYDPRYVYMLTKQGRMHHDIAEFPNYAFYGNKLEVVPLDHQTLPCQMADTPNGIARLLTSRRVTFVAAENSMAPASPKTNATEAKLIAAVVVEIYRLDPSGFSTSGTVGVIVPYRNQIATIRHAIDLYAISCLHDITIDTVERYQGSQRDFIIYGFTVQQPYQLNFLTNNVFEEDGLIIDRKLNVAMTRARRHLMLIGNPSLLDENYTFHMLLEFVRRKDGFFSIEPERFCRGDFEVSAPRECRQTDLTAARDVLPRELSAAVSREIASPMAADSRTPSQTTPLGNGAEANLAAINYGRSGFSINKHVFSKALGRMLTLTPDDQARLYCLYLMPANYAFIKDGICSIKPQIEDAAAHGCRTATVIDIGCGPGTCLHAVRELIATEFRHTSYVGIDTSEAMTNLAQRLWADSYGPEPGLTVAPSLDAISGKFFEATGGQPRLVVFTLAFFLPNIDATTAEHTATTIKSIMRRHGSNKYIIKVIQSADDNKTRPSVVWENTMRY